MAVVASVPVFFMLVLVALVSWYLIVAGGLLVRLQKSAIYLHGAHSARKTETAGDLPLRELQSAPTTAYHVFQVGRHHTGSTLLANILWGLFDGVDTKYAMHGRDSRTRLFGVSSNDAPAHINVTVVTKTHYDNIDHMLEEYSKQFHKVFFVVSNRGSERVDSKYCQDEKYFSLVTCFEYETFAYTCNDGNETMANEIREGVVSNVAKQIQGQLVYFSEVNFDIKRAAERLRKMDETTEAIKNRPFGYADPTFGMHGGHRNREKPSPRKQVVIARSNPKGSQTQTQNFAIQGQIQKNK